MKLNDRPVGRAVTRLSLEREVLCSYLGPVKSDAVLPTDCHRCDISSKEAVYSSRAMTRRRAPAYSFTLQRNTMSIVKDLVNI